MKFTPLKSSETTQGSNTKPLSCSNTTRNTSFHRPTTTDSLSNLYYEPTSVLDVRRSPSPAADVPPSAAGILPSLPDALAHSDDLTLHSDDVWDKLFTGLGLPDADDSGTDQSRAITQLGPCIDPQFPLVPDFPPSQLLDYAPLPFGPTDFNFCDQSLNSFDLSNDVQWNLGFDFAEDLIRAAECVESNDLNLAQGILARLNQRLQTPAGKPLQRAAFYFKEALHSLVAGSNRPNRCSTSSEIVQTIRAYKAFSGMSPIPMFSHFTANQALLEAVDGLPFIHVIDFDIGLGGKWASFMREIADRTDVRKVISPVLRISAVVPEEFAVESRLIGDSLTQFAHELRLGFQIEFVLIRAFEFLSFKAIKFMDREKTAVHISPATLTRLAATNGVAAFLTNLRLLSPRVVVFVDGEGWADAGTSSFSRDFVNGLEFYTAMLESLDATGSGGGGGGGGGVDWVRKIETFLLKPKIFAALEAAGRRATPWKEVFAGAGLRVVQLSQFADFQAECLLGKAQVKGFHVSKRHGEMVLCWHDKPMVATSAWKC
ncbi:scarecrow-like protein 15 [Malania oleifera]|uniref:scarecrow-like protein 15 n=1 Tax=Malania oleifera TaxID=397392 RepID=UPI0025AE984D|nr:scarecrow-like protein 15 [Malania oleifera]